MSYEVDGEHMRWRWAPQCSRSSSAVRWHPGQHPRRRRVAARGESPDHRNATLVQSADRGVGSRYAIDEHTFNPIRARVKADRWLTFVNNGSEAHTIAALDGSFTVQTLKTAESDSVKLLRLGTVRYACKEHPWAVGELTVEQ